MSVSTLNENVKATQDYHNQYFIGTVVEQDPDGLQRFKATIPGVFDEGELPWILPAKSSPFGVGSGFGTYGCPAIGSKAIIEFQAGDVNYPICLGFLLAQSDVDPEFSSPDVWGFKDPRGNKLVVNLQTGQWMFVHSSGTSYQIDGSGNLTVNTAGYTNITVNGTTTINSSGDTRVTAPNIYLN